jgi:molybdopterin-guanine dinucleotide biosynthesis protein
LIITVGELIEELKKFDKDLDVVVEGFENDLPIERVCIENNEVKICEIV